MVVMCAWLFDIALSAMLNAARFDLGFYRRAHLRALRGELRAGGTADRQLSRLQAKLVAAARVRRKAAPPNRNIRSERERLFSAVAGSSNDAIITKTAWRPDTPAGIRPPSTVRAIRAAEKVGAAHRHYRTARRGAETSRMHPQADPPPARCATMRPAALHKAAAASMFRLSTWQRLRRAAGRRGIFRGRARHHRKQANAGGAEPGTARSGGVSSRRLA